jgi:glycine/D-amino acid oxidase-like deaminating enzyme
MTAMTLDRRLLMGSLAALTSGTLGGCATDARHPPTLSPLDVPPRLAPIRAHPDRLFDITVCLRPFRATGPRLDTEMLGDTLVVHNYGHGGSGWSLSWGSAAIAVAKALARGHKDVAVIGCGALGITAAITARRAGANVTVYCKDELMQARSARATGSWTPDSRIALKDPAGPAFADLWEQMARVSWKTYRNYLGLPGNPVEWADRYQLSDVPPDHPAEAVPGALVFGEYQERIADLTPRPVDIPPGATPFQVPHVRRTSNMQFNIAAYAHLLLADFREMGGRIEVREFHTPSELTALKEKVVINCTGYGARALWKDESVVPVRGQIGWLIPQPEVAYGLVYRGVSVISRTDGIVVQAVEGGDMKGYGNDHEVIDRQEAEHAVGVIADLYSRWT